MAEEGDSKCSSCIIISIIIIINACFFWVTQSDSAVGARAPGKKAASSARSDFKTRRVSRDASRSRLPPSRSHSTRLMEGKPYTLCVRLDRPRKTAKFPTRASANPRARAEKN